MNNTRCMNKNAAEHGLRGEARGVSAIIDARGVVTGQVQVRVGQTLARYVAAVALGIVLTAGWTWRATIYTAITADDRAVPCQDGPTSDVPSAAPQRLSPPPLRRTRALDAARTPTPASPPPADARDRELDSTCGSACEPANVGGEGRVARRLRRRWAHRARSK
jgi:hypothetical protein